MRRTRSSRHLYCAGMSRLPRFRLVSGVTVALLGVVVLFCSYMNVGYFADLDETARQLGDDGTFGSLASFAAGLLLVALGVINAGTAFLVPHAADEATPAATARPSRAASN